MASLPSVAASAGLSRTLRRSGVFPCWSRRRSNARQALARAEDTEAAQKTRYLAFGLVARIAMGYRGYGLPIGEVVSEGNVGLMQAVKRFDPEKGFRLATYAMWWIRAAIQE